MRHARAFGLLASSLLLASLPASAQNGPPAERGKAARYSVSPAWRDIPVARPTGGGPPREIPNKSPFRLEQRARDAGPKSHDPIAQVDQFPVSGAAATPAPIASFEGLSDDDNAAFAGVRIVPPDTQGDVGPAHYVQWTNLLFAVYDKATGNRVFGPRPGNSLWAGFGGVCESNNDGDPVVLYDHLADRWMISQFAVADDGWECIAVSTTGDPTGAYHRYAFRVSPNAFNDYPKLGLWADAYLMSANEFNGSGGSAGFGGAVLVAFDRAAMLAGDPDAGFVKFGQLPCGSECYFTVQPAHLEGPAPPAGTPATFVMAWDDATWGSGLGPDGYRMFELAVDWSNPGASTLTQLPQVDDDPFSSNMCNYNRACIPQPRGRNRGEGLDSLAQFTMFRAQYRHFGTHDSIVLNHTVDVTGADQAGIRWAELRNDGAGWFRQQSGTYAPDGEHRWIGSIAMDGEGNIALGYNVSSENTFPSLRYVTRSATDPLGTLPGGEVELIAGGGAQSSSYNRWGDYATMSVDPVDDCTFWFTGEYYANNGSFDFKTRIGSFNVCDGGGDPPSCTPTETSEQTCNDGLDNDCDGFFDLDDLDCDSSGSCTLGQAGDACVDDGDCCSNNCKGKPGAKTCK